MQVKSGQFALDPGANGTQFSITGVGFQPELVLFFATRTTNTGELAGKSDGQLVFGAVSATTEQRVAGIAKQNTGSDSRFKQIFIDDRGCIGVSEAAGSGNADRQIAKLASFDADGFTLEIIVDTDGTGNSWICHYIAFEGLDNAKVGDVNLADANNTGLFSTTGVGFEPNALILFSAGVVGVNRTAPNGSRTSNGVFCIGMTDGTNQNVLALGDNGTGTDDSAAYFYNDECYAHVVSNSVRHRAQISSFDADGFTLDFLEGEGTVGDEAANEAYYVALQVPAGAVEVVDALTQTTTGAFSVDGSKNFLRKAVLATGWRQGVSTQNSASTGANGYIGVAEGSDERLVGTEFGDGATLNGNAWILQLVDRVLGHLGDSTTTIESETEQTGYSATGVDLNQRVADSAQHAFGMLQIGVPAGGPRMILMFSEMADRLRGWLTPKPIERPEWKPEPQVITPMKRPA